MKTTEIVKGGYYFIKSSLLTFGPCVIKINNLGSLQENRPKKIDYDIYNMKGKKLAENASWYLEELCDHLERRVKPKIK